ncbi:hypothetical protein CsSME_00006389 [Camellia sinensis var. sinensis]
MGDGRRVRFCLYTGICMVTGILLFLGRAILILTMDNLRCAKRSERKAWQTTTLCALWTIWTE